MKLQRFAGIACPVSCQRSNFDHFHPIPCFRSQTSLITTIWNIFVQTRRTASGTLWCRWWWSWACTRGAILSTQSASKPSSSLASLSSSTPSSLLSRSVPNTFDENCISRFSWFHCLDLIFLLLLRSLLRLDGLGLQLGNLERGLLLHWGRLWSTIFPSLVDTIQDIFLTMIW